jgi:hypothetical protein
MTFGLGVDSANNPINGLYGLAEQALDLAQLHQALLMNKGDGIRGSRLFVDEVTIVQWLRMACPVAGRNAPDQRTV